MKENRFSESKDQAIKSLSEDIRNSKSIALVGIERVPGKQFQEIRRALRRKAGHYLILIGLGIFLHTQADLMKVREAHCCLRILSGLCQRWQQ